LLAVYLATGIYSVRPNELAVVRRCGKVLEQHRLPGLHFGLPYGIDRVTRVKFQEQKRVSVGMSQTEKALGRRNQPRDSEYLTGDRNLIMISANVQYQIDDPNDYLFNAVDVAALVGDAAAGRLASVISGMNVDDVLTIERSTIQTEVKTATQKALNGYAAGVRVTSVLLDEDTEPPQEVAEAFRDVTAAREDRQRLINEAQGYANRLKEQAEADANSLLEEAEGFAGEARLMARGDADRFRQIAQRLPEQRSLTLKRLILETMEEVLPRMKKIVLDRPAAESVDLGIIEANP
jgi:membrane protease subunit HflK